MCPHINTILIEEIKNRRIGFTSPCFPKLLPVLGGGRSDFSLFWDARSVPGFVLVTDQFWSIDWRCPSSVNRIQHLLYEGEI